jgi:hypothetical protein
LRVVVVDGDDLIYASPANLDHAHRTVGLTLTASGAGQPSTAITYGPASDGGWNWDPDLPLWLGVDGTLTQTPPVAGYLRIVATAISPGSILFNPDTPILL